MVGRGDAGALRARKVWTIGCPGGTWPPKCVAGTVTTTGRSSLGNTITVGHAIAGGHSGGALIDQETGMLLGVTNWSGDRYSMALHSSEWEAALLKAMK